MMRLSEAYIKALNTTLLEASLGNEDEIGRRREFIRSNPNSIKYVGSAALHSTVRLLGRKRLLWAYGLPYRGRGLEVLGHGYHSTAIREPDNDSVSKIIRGSDLLDEAGKQELMRELEQKIAPNIITHPLVAVPTTVDIKPSPLLKRPTVEITQPFIARVQDAIDPREVYQFAEKSLDEMLPDGYLPDVLGSENLINTEVGVRLIDTVAIGVEETRAFGMCAAILYRMTRTRE